MQGSLISLIVAVVVSAATSASASAAAPATASAAAPAAASAVALVALIFVAPPLCIRDMHAVVDCWVVPFGAAVDVAFFEFFTIIYQMK